MFVKEVLEEPRSGTPALNVMAIRDQRHTNVSKQRAFLADVDIARRSIDPMTGKCFFIEKLTATRIRVSFKVSRFNISFCTKLINHEFTFSGTVKRLILN